MTIKFIWDKSVVKKIWQKINLFDIIVIISIISISLYSINFKLWQSNKILKSEIKQLENLVRITECDKQKYQKDFEKINKLFLENKECQIREFLFELYKNNKINAILLR